MAGSIKIGFQLIGAERVRRALDHASIETLRRVALAIGTTAYEVAQGARARVPVRTGELASTIRAEPSAASQLVWHVKAGFGTLKRRGRRTRTTRRRRPVARQLGPIEPGIYAMVVEFGSQSGRARQPAQPYMFPALEASRARHLERLKRALFDACETVARSA